MRSFGNVLAAALAAALFSTAAWAGGNHKGAHYTFGEPGEESEVTRTVEVTATDDMRLLMDVPSIRQGETIKFVVINRGEIPHEFSVGDTGSQRAHANLMRRNPDMTHHDDPAAVTLEPGETKTIVWRFSKPIQGHVVFACQTLGRRHALQGQVRDEHLPGRPIQDRAEVAEDHLAIQVGEARVPDR